MNDNQIIDLFFERSEEAISVTADKYGRYCYTIAHNILNDAEDSEECVNDTYLKAWESIPPKRPEKLAAFLGKLTRNLAIDRYRYYASKKRCEGQIMLALDELAECVPASDDTEKAVTDKELTEVLNRFLADLPAEKRQIFMRRYWYMSQVKDIAEDFGISESKVKMTLLRLRNKLKQILEREGIVL